MDAFLKGILDKLPPWFYSLSAILFLAVLIIFFAMTLFGASRITRAMHSIMSRDRRIEQLHDRLHESIKRAEWQDNVASQLATACGNLSPLLHQLNALRSQPNPMARMSEIESLAQRCLDTLSSDIKVSAGGRHRCALWVQQDEELMLVFATSGFPKTHPGNRRLHIHRSIAGRCLRKRQLIHVDDVTEDDDWEPNHESKTTYHSLICVPVSTWVVLTVDGLQPMSREVELLCELYGVLFEGIFQEQVNTIQRLSGESLQEDSNVSSIGIHYMVRSDPEGVWIRGSQTASSDTGGRASGASTK